VLKEYMLKLVDYMEEFDYGIDECSDLGWLHVCYFIDDELIREEGSKLPLREVYDSFLDYQKQRPIIPRYSFDEFFSEFSTQIKLPYPDRGNVDYDPLFLYGYRFSNQDFINLKKLQRLKDLGNRNKLNTQS